jgi:hypothetical protein
MSGRRGYSMVKGHMFAVLLLTGAGSLAAQATRPAPAPAAATAQARHVIVNKVALSDAQVAGLEQQFQTQIRDGAYWYDTKTGAWGLEGGPTAGLIPAGLNLGGTLQPDASNGNTGVFINGRELHALDVMALQQLGPVYRGRYWMDAMGNVGFEGGPPLLNLYVLAQQRSGKTGKANSVYTRDGSMMTGTDGNGCYVFNDASTHTSWAGSGC